MSIPFEPILFGIKINVHLILEYLAFFIAFRYYVYLRKRTTDQISSTNRLVIILGAILGAFLGSRIMGFLENPILDFDKVNWIQLLNIKTIMGGLFGGLLGVEWAKKSVGESQSSGDLFTFPIIVGIIIGRMGCFLSGTNEFTYGSQTQFFTGMNLGDGIMRHPIALYEIIFLLLLFIILKKCTFKTSGMRFISFMLAYFTFRFIIEFIKPNLFLIVGLSSIQWLCVICWLYYMPILTKIFKNAD